MIFLLSQFIKIKKFILRLDFDNADLILLFFKSIIKKPIRITFFLFVTLLYHNKSFIVIS